MPHLRPADQGTDVRHSSQAGLLCRSSGRMFHR